jgi:hypothetical protein
LSLLLNQLALDAWRSSQMLALNGNGRQSEQNPQPAYALRQVGSAGGLVLHHIARRVATNSRALAVNLRCGAAMQADWAGAAGDNLTILGDNAATVMMLVRLAAWRKDAQFRLTPPGVPVSLPAPTKLTAEQSNTVLQVVATRRFMRQPSACGYSQPSAWRARAAQAKAKAIATAQPAAAMHAGDGQAGSKAAGTTSRRQIGDPQIERQFPLVMRHTRQNLRLDRLACPGSCSISLIYMVPRALMQGALSFLRVCMK